jgi:hypothetical protein
MKEIYVSAPVERYKQQQQQQQQTQNISDA